jgi:hypothetical protein
VCIQAFSKGIFLDQECSTVKAQEFKETFPKSVGLLFLLQLQVSFESRQTFCSQIRMPLLINNILHLMLLLLAFLSFVKGKNNFRFYSTMHHEATTAEFHSLRRNIMESLPVRLPFRRISGDFSASSRQFLNTTRLANWP